MEKPNQQLNAPKRMVKLGSSKELVLRSLETERIVSIDLKLTSAEREILHGLNIEIEGIVDNFLYWGNVNNQDLLLNLRLYLDTLGKNGEEDGDIVSQLQVIISKQVTAFFDTEFEWIETKTFLANDTFAIPRWHTDNKFFTPHTAYKFAWAAKGPQTRFGITDNLPEFERLTELEINANH